jgi:DUF1009 family protein
MAARRLTLVAGTGALVPHLMQAIGRKQVPLQIIDIAGRDDPGSTALSIPVGDAARLIAAITAFGTTHLVLAGAVHISDAARLAMAQLLAASGPPASGQESGSRRSGGRGLSDIGIFDMIELYCQRAGIRLVGAHRVAPELLAPEGHIGGPPLPRGVEPGPALRVARAVGSIDLGQSVVVSGQRPVAAEDTGGTDDLLHRVGVLRAAGLVGNGDRPLVLAKARKPRQPHFADLPAIGPDTVVNARAAGISAIVVEARASLLIERAALEAAAAEHGVAVVGARHHG